MPSIRSLLFTVPLALTAAHGWQDDEWSYTPDKTAEWYKQHGKPLPELATELSVDEEERNYVVKLECVGCPFRVREYRERVETWQVPAQENSLLLNFTVNEDGSNVLVNNAPILSLESRPSAVEAFQVPANTSVNTMDKIVGMHMCDSNTWNLGTKYGYFELQYERMRLATKQAGVELLQFDVTGIHMRQNWNSGSYNLEQEDQKMVQILLGREANGDKNVLSIKHVEIVARKDRQQPIKMACGKLAMQKTTYNPLEWDHYGKFDTLARKWHVFWWNTLDFFEQNAPFLVLIGLILAFVKFVRWYTLWRQERAALQVKLDDEVALLDSEQHDAPPEYFDVDEERKEEGH